MKYKYTIIIFLVLFLFFDIGWYAYHGWLIPSTHGGDALSITMLNGVILIFTIFGYHMDKIESSIK